MKFYYKENGEIKQYTIADEEFRSDIDPLENDHVPQPFKDKIDSIISIDGKHPGFDAFPKSKKGRIYFIDEQTARDLGYLEDPYSGKFIKISTYRNTVEHMDELPAAGIGNCNLTDHNGSKNSKFVKGNESPSFRSTGGLEYKFGVELETCSGLVPPYVYYQDHLSLKCDKDGSLREEDGTLRGGEYVTGILHGDMGIHQLYNICKELGKRCKVDRKTGLHVHIGYTLFTKEFSVMAYMLGRKIQEDFFSIMPGSRRSNPYCNFLPDLGYEKIIRKHGWEYGIQMCYSDLMRKLSNGKELGSQINKFNPHPEGRWAGSNGRGEIETLRKLYRYKWLNLIPSNFNQNKKPIKNDGNLGKNVPFSIEFRHHSGTLNFGKVKNFVLLCMAFVHYVDNHKREILDSDPISLEDIVTATYSGEKQNELLKYIDRRRDKFEGIPEMDQDDKEHNEEVYTEDMSLTDIVKSS